MSREQNRETKAVEKRGITPARRRRINRLKKMIVWTILSMILFPVLGCIILGVNLYRARKSVDTMARRIEDLEGTLQEYVDEADRTEALLELNEEILQKTQDARAAENLQMRNALVADVSGNEAGAEAGNRKVYLTFDDGPSVYTEELLDILKEYDVKATFFVTGKGKERYSDTYRRMVEEGHTLGMHSYSHEYTNIYASLGNFKEDLETLRDYLYDVTGQMSRFYRFPGGSSNRVSGTNIQELTAYLDAMDIAYFDWNISAGDATGVSVESDQIVNRVMSQIPDHQVGVVLMHDAADKHSTVEALPKLIEEIRALEDGTEILPITDETMLIQHVASRKAASAQE